MDFERKFLSGILSKLVAQMSKTCIVGDCNIFTVFLYIVI